MEHIQNFDSFVNEEFNFNIFSNDKIKEIKNRIENSEQYKKTPNALEMLSRMIRNLWDMWKSSLTNKEKASKMQNILKASIWGTLLPGIYGLVFNTEFHWFTSTDWGGTTWLGIALCLLILKVIHMIFSKGGIALTNVKEFWNEITKENPKEETLEEKPISERFYTFEKYELTLLRN